MRPIGLAVVLAVSLTLAPLVVEAQPAAKVGRLGFLGPSFSEDDPRAENLRAFREALQNLGYVDGKTIAIEWRLADNYELYPALAAELVRLNVNVLVTPNTPGALAAKRATSTIPIVIIAVGDPVGSGIVSSLARPGGNVTGLSIFATDLYAKRLELLKEALPKTSRVALLFNPTNPVNVPLVKETQDAARKLKVQFHPVGVRDLDDFERAFAEMNKERIDGLMIAQDAFLLNHRIRIADFARRNRMPTMYEVREFVEVGGLMSYGPSRSDSFRRAAIYVDKILKGAKPADLPVEQPTKFELVINLKTAKAIGLTIPQSVLGRADHVIE